ncbi:MAG: hypothetical protein KGJ34_01745 [Patescibacteria group bacterium]|nr:hypothetical protein [Patescibacteria group bacterium]
MQIKSGKIGGGTCPPGKYQLGISVIFGLPVVLTVICRSASRNETSYEIFDQHDVSMGGRNFTYAALRKTMNDWLVDDLNVLLEEFGIAIDRSEFQEVSDTAANACEARYGNGLEDGDVIIMLH